MRVTESNLRQMIRNMLTEADTSSMFGRDKPYQETPYTLYLERALEILKSRAEAQAGPDVNSVQEFHMVVGPDRQGKSHNGLIVRLYAEPTFAMPWTKRPQKVVAGIAGDYTEETDYTVGIRDVLGPDVDKALNEALAQAAKEMGVQPVMVDTQRQVAYAGRAKGEKGATRYALQFTLKKPGPTPVVHVVRRGDNLGKIAAMYRDKMGMGSDVRNDDVAAEIAQFNGMTDPDSIRPGDRIKIPVKK